MSTASISCAPRGAPMMCADISAALAERAEQLALDLIGDKPSSRAHSELRFGSKGALSIKVAGPHRGHFTDFSAGVSGDMLDLIGHARNCNPAEARAWALGWLGIAPAERVSRPAPQRRQPANDVDDTARNQAIANRLWAEARPFHGSLAERYLRNRVGVDLQEDYSHALRFHPRCRFGGAGDYPAMIARMVDPISGADRGIHRTALAEPGRKAPIDGPKRMLGHAGVIRLTADEFINYGIGICEGIETGIALIERASLTFMWAAGSAGGIRNFPVLHPVINSIWIFADSDDGGVSVKAAHECRDRWQKAEREVRVLIPPPGTDWADCATKMQEAA
jgi:putative DNA primase/helicase